MFLRIHIFCLCVYGIVCFLQIVLVVEDQTTCDGWTSCPTRLEHKRIRLKIVVKYNAVCSPEIRPLAKLGKAVNIADASNQRKAKSETASAVAVAFREDTKPFDKADSVFHKDTLL